MRSVILLRTWCQFSAVSTNLCGMDPYIQISSVLPCFSDQLGDSSSVLKTARHPRSPSFLHWCINVTIFKQKVSHPLGQNAEEEFALNTEQRDGPKLLSVCGIIFLGYPHTFSIFPLACNNSTTPYCPQEFPEQSQQIWAAIINYMARHLFLGLKWISLPSTPPRFEINL